MYQESRAYTVKTRPYTICITTQRFSGLQIRRWRTVTEERHSFRDEHAIVKYLARNVIFANNTWLLGEDGQAVRRTSKDTRIVLWGFHQEKNSILCESLNINPLVERARFLATNK